MVERKKKMISGKYKTYKELADAFKSGELDSKLYFLWVDNDAANLYYKGDEMDEDEAYDHCHSLFSDDRPIDVVEILRLAGIPSENC